MNKREGAILSAFTGYTIGVFEDFHEYAEEIMHRPIWTHEFASKEFCKQIKEAARKDFMNININKEFIEMRKKEQNYDSSGKDLITKISSPVRLKDFGGF